MASNNKETMSAVVSSSSSSAGRAVGSVARNAVFRSICARASTFRGETNFAGVMQLLRNNAAKITLDQITESKSNAVVLGQAAQAIEDIMITVLNTPIAVRQANVEELDDYLESLESCVEELMAYVDDGNLAQIQELVERANSLFDAYFEGGGDGNGSDEGGSEEGSEAPEEEEPQHPVPRHNQPASAQRAPVNGFLEDDAESEDEALFR